MITSIQNRLVPAGKQPSAASTIQRPVRTPVASKAEFHKLLQPSIGGASASTAGKTAATSSTSQSTSQTPAAGTPIPIPPITDLHDQSQVEAHMNGWLENVTQNANAQKTQIYQQAMSDWQINSQRCQDLGLPSPPKPTQPTLDAVQAMPTGWWFQT